MPSSAYSYLVKDPDNLISLKSHPDNFLIDQNSGYGIEQSRKLTVWLFKKPFSRSYKIVLIKKAENLTIEAQNALLKSIEEPPHHNFLFFSFQNSDRLIPTLKSRCEIVTTDQFKNRKLSHIPDDLNWLDEFEFSAGKTQTSTDYPALAHPAEAFKVANKLSKMPRQRVLDYLEDWSTYLITENPQKNYLIVDEILKAKEYLSHNANIQLTLEVILLRMANLK